MKQQSVIEGNRVINEFAPEITKNLFAEEMYYIPDHIEFIPVLKYHSSWDWLQPAWSKFYVICETELRGKEKLYNEFAGLRDNYCIHANHNDIKTAFETIVEAIQWYNTHNPSTPKP